jgi:hypothetical protein
MESTWRKKVTFTDSCKILTFSMSQLLEDSVGLLVADAAKGTSLEEAFGTTLKYLLAKGYRKEDFIYLLKENSKFVMPFERIDLLAYLRQQSSVPPKEHFASLLGGRATLSARDYDLFLNTWNRLGIEDMFQLFKLYLAMDVTNLTCVLDFYFQKIFRQTRLYPANFFTISSLALGAALMNSCNPEQPGTGLTIPLLDAETYNVFSEALIGRYSSTNAKLASWNPCQEAAGSKETTGGWFLDINCLYPAILTSDLPFSEYTHFLDSDEDNSYYKLLKKKLKESDVNFFWSLYYRDNLKVFVQGQT